MTAVAWDPSKHPRHPVGSEAGGEFASKEDVGDFVRRAISSQHSNPPRFPAGEFTPEDKVKFWPMTMGAYSGFRQDAPYGPFWKAVLDADGNELAFWFADVNGNPHHDDMIAALMRAGAWGEGGNTFDRAGYGLTPDRHYLEPQDMEAAEAIVRRHRKDIKDANEFLETNQAMAASALNLESDALVKATERLQRQYEKVYRRAAKRAAADYREATKVVQAAGQPQPEEVVKAQALLESFLLLTGAARRSLLRQILEALYVLRPDDRGRAISEYVELLQEQVGVQAARLSAGVQDAAADVMLTAMGEGWSIPQTAKAIQEKLESIAPWQATMLARTDLIALGNGASLQRAVILDSPDLQFKTWLATPDERTRVDHRHAHGQTVPIQQPFTVGGEQLLYPGDPAASDGNVINCRCTVIYGATPVGPLDVQRIHMLPDLAVSAAGWDESKHPRHPAGTPDGGQFAALQLYTANSFDLNAALRGLRPFSQYQSETVATLDALIDEHGEASKSDDMTVYRGVGERGGSQDHWTELGYLSTTEDRDIAWDFGYDGRVLEIKVPEGMRFYRVPEGAYEYNQREVIFPRGTEFRLEKDGTYTALTHYKKPELPLVQAAAWNEAKHPRHPEGSEQGGEFAPKNFYYGAMLARDENDRAIGYQAFRRERGQPLSLGVRGRGVSTLVGPVRDTYQEATNDAKRAEDEGRGEPHEPLFPTRAMPPYESTRAWRRAAVERASNALSAAGWDPSEHPRHPAGSPEGGEFAPAENAAGAIVDWAEAEGEFQEWAAELAPYYTEHPPGYWDSARTDMWGMYQDWVNTQLPELQARLNGAQVPGLVITPQLNPQNDGDMDVVLDPERRINSAPDFMVTLPAAEGGLPPSFAVWTYPEGANARHAGDPDWYEQPEGVQVEDVLDITDTDFFPDGPDSDLAADYARAVDAARGVPQPGFVTIYRGMGDAEYDSWEAGDEIPLGKWFAGIPTAQFAQDISGAPPNLYSFRIPRHMLMQTGEYEYQLKKKGRMRNGVIELSQSLRAAGVSYEGQGGMVCLYPTSEEAEAIAREKGQPAEDLHVTLLYFEDGVPGDATELIGDLEFEGLAGEITGVARFKEGEDGVPIVGLVSAPGLGNLRTDLARRLPGYSERHDFMPHVTLGYDYVKDEDGAVGLPVTFSSVQVKNKGEEPQDVLTAAVWDETKHARHPGGTEKGGEFAPKARPVYNTEVLGYDEATGNVMRDLYRELSEWPEGEPKMYANWALERAEMESENSLFTTYRDGRLVGVAVTVPWGEGADQESYLYGAYAGAIEGAGLETFRTMISEAAVYGLGLKFEAGTEGAKKLYRKLGAREEAPGIFELTPEDVRMLAGDILAKAREKRAMAAAAWVPEDEWPENWWIGTPRELAAAGWEESEHPRWPAGSERGGEFMPKDGMIGSDARLGRQSDGTWRVSKAPNLREWMKGMFDEMIGPSDILDDWPNLSHDQAVRLRNLLKNPLYQEELAKRGMGKYRKEAEWVLRDLDDGGIPGLQVPETPPAATGPMQPGETRSVLDKLVIGGGQNAANMLEAARTVDATLRYPKVPGEPEIKIRGVAGGRSRQATFWRRRGTHQPTEITVAGQGVNPISSVTHELGHYLDSLLGQDDWVGGAIGRRQWNDYSSRQATGTLQPVVTAIKETDMYKRLASGALTSSTSTFHYAGRYWSPGRSHINYLMRPEELIARSYEQYIAAKNPDSKLGQTQRHLMPNINMAEYPGYMYGDDLEYVNETWDRILQERGLLKKEGFPKAQRRTKPEPPPAVRPTPRPRAVDPQEAARRDVLRQIERMLK